MNVAHGNYNNGRILLQIEKKKKNHAVARSLHKLWIQKWRLAQGGWLCRWVCKWFSDNPLKLLDLLRIIDEWKSFIMKKQFTLLLDIRITAAHKNDTTSFILITIDFEADSL